MSEFKVKEESYRKLIMDSACLQAIRQMARQAAAGNLPPGALAAAVQAICGGEEETPVPGGEEGEGGTPRQPKAAGKKGGKKKILDRGKIAALNEAGWSARDIASDMHCTESAIYKVLEEQRRAEADAQEGGAE